jgi:hypothetical protein
MSKEPELLLRGWRAGAERFWAALKVRPAALAARKPPRVPR